MEEIGSSGAMELGKFEVVPFFFIKNLLSLKNDVLFIASH